VGRTYASRIQAWQPRAQSSAEVDWVKDMTQEYAQHVLTLDAQIAALEATMAQVAQDSVIATTLASLPRLRTVCSTELAGEIGTVPRFPHEGILALYLDRPPWTTVPVHVRAPSPRSRSTHAPRPR
jgi:transposase